MKLFTTLFLLMLQFTLYGSQTVHNVDIMDVFNNPALNEHVISSLDELREEFGLIASAAITPIPDNKKPKSKSISEIDTLRPIRIDKKLYQCPICTHTSNNSSNMIRHISGKHLKEKKHVCETCEKAFHQKNHLTAHILTHTNERPFPCTWPQCNEKFTQQGGLKTHMFTHTKQKPFQCSLCDYATITNSFLNRHIKKHHPETLCSS